MVSTGWCRGIVASAVVVTGLVGSANAQDEATEILNRVHQKYETVTDAEVKFTQKTKFSLGKVSQSVAGVLTMKKANHYRAELGDQIVVTDGTTVWSYSAATKQVIIDRFKLDERTVTPERILTGSPTGFTPTLVGRELLGKTPVVQIKLLPKDDQSLIAVMRLWVDEKEWMIHQAEIEDVNGKKTTYTIQQIRLNIGVPDARFTFQPPHGTEAVDLR